MADVNRLTGDIVSVSAYEVTGEPQAIPRQQGLQAPSLRITSGVFQIPTVLGAPVLLASYDSGEDRGSRMMHRSLGGAGIGALLGLVLGIYRVRRDPVTSREVFIGIDVLIDAARVVFWTTIGGIGGAIAGQVSGYYSK
ncbi:MAG: hypothetical protein HYT77_07515 [Deltaproteobacteria bacterium]|nr:hypothetical protein [Deltaproteobacteria bacterium]